MLFAGENLNRKRAKNSECLLLKWFQQCRDNNVNIGGMLLKDKAEYFVKTLGHNKLEFLQFLFKIKFYFWHFLEYVVVLILQNNVSFLIS